MQAVEAARHIRRRLKKLLVMLMSKRRRPARKSVQSCTRQEHTEEIFAPENVCAPNGSGEQALVDARLFLIEKRSRGSGERKRRNIIAHPPTLRVAIGLFTCSPLICSDSCRRVRGAAFLCREMVGCRR